MPSKKPVQKAQSHGLFPLGLLSSSDRFSCLHLPARRLDPEGQVLEFFAVPWPS